jgi:HD-like signal output (HDOD) protein
MRRWNRLRRAVRKTQPKKKVRKYFREVMQKHQLPALPVVVMKVLGMVQDPECDVRALRRVLSDEELSLFQAR